MRTAFPRLHAEAQAALQHHASTQLHTGERGRGSPAFRVQALATSAARAGWRHCCRALPTIPRIDSEPCVPSLAHLCLPVCLHGTAEKAYRQVRPGAGILSLTGLAAFTSDGRRTRSQVRGLLWLWLAEQHMLACARGVLTCSPRGQAASVLAGCRVKRPGCG